jgi:hypothetical protein
MKFNYITKNHEQTKLLEEKIKLLEDSGCFSVLCGSHEFNVQYLSGTDNTILLEPVNPNTEVLLGNIYKKDIGFKIANVSFSDKEAEFSIKGVEFKYKG